MTVKKPKYYCGLVDTSLFSELKMTIQKNAVIIFLNVNTISAFWFVLNIQGLAGMFILGLLVIKQRDVARLKK